MGLFSFTQEIAMDLGTANTIITTNGKIVCAERRAQSRRHGRDKQVRSPAGRRSAAG